MGLRSCTTCTYYSVGIYGSICEISYSTVIEYDALSGMVQILSRFLIYGREHNGSQIMYM